MKKFYIFLITLFLISCNNTKTVSAYIPYTDFYPSIGVTQYLGDTQIGEHIFSIYIADDDTINTMIYWKYYTAENRKWTVKVLLVPHSEKWRQAFVKMINEGANNDTWAINNHLSLPINNEVWALREDVSYYPNDKKLINIRGAWIYNTDGEMLGFDKRRLQKTIAHYYGEGENSEIYDQICDFISEFMSQRYQDAVLNSQNFAR